MKQADQLQNKKHELYKQEAIFEVAGVNFENPQGIKNIYFEEETGKTDETAEEARKKREEQEKQLIEQRGPALGELQEGESLEDLRRKKSLEEEKQQQAIDLERIIKIGGVMYANDLQQPQKPHKSPLLIEKEEEEEGEKK